MEALAIQTVALQARVKGESVVTRERRHGRGRTVSPAPYSSRPCRIHRGRCGTPPARMGSGRRFGSRARKVLSPLRTFGANCIKNSAVRSSSMSIKPTSFPEIRAIMVSFDMLPRQDAGLMQMARYDLSRMKSVVKAKNAVARSNAYRVQRTERLIQIEFLDMNQPEGKQIKMRFIYELMPPFR